MAKILTRYTLPPLEKKKGKKKEILLFNLICIALLYISLFMF